VAVWTACGLEGVGGSRICYGARLRWPKGLPNRHLSGKARYAVADNRGAARCLTEDEIFYVLRGELTFRCGAESFDVSEGGFIYLPQGIEHGYPIRSGEPVRLIVVTFPASAATGEGWGGFIADVESQGELIAGPGHRQTFIYRFWTLAKYDFRIWDADFR